MASSKQIVLIGAGNVATQLGISLTKAGCKIIQVYSRTDNAAQQLAKKLKCDFTSDLDALEQEADVFILAVKDDAIELVLQQINFQPALIVHTSGAVESSVFKSKFKNYGVLYPLQIGRAHV